MPVCAFAAASAYTTACMHLLPCMMPHHVAHALNLLACPSDLHWRRQLPNRLCSCVWHIGGLVRGAYAVLQAAWMGCTSARNSAMQPVKGHAFRHRCAKVRLYSFVCPDIRACSRCSCQYATRQATVSRMLHTQLWFFDPVTAAYLN